MYLTNVVWGMDWVDLAQDVDRGRAVVNALRRPGFRIMREVS